MRIAIELHCVFPDTLHGSSHTSVSFVLRFSFICLFMCFMTFYWSFQEPIDGESETERERTKLERSEDRAREKDE